MGSKTIRVSAEMADNARQKQFLSSDFCSVKDILNK